LNLKVKLHGIALFSSPHQGEIKARDGDAVKVALQKPEKSVVK
jgi:hypothetical protein